MIPSNTNGNTIPQDPPSTAYHTAMTSHHDNKHNNDKHTYSLPSLSLANQHFETWFQLIVEKLENMVNEYVALKDMMEDWTTEILKAVRMTSTGDNTPTGNTPHWPMQISSPVPNKNDEYFGNIQHKDNEKLDNNGNTHQSRSQRTPTARNRHETPSVRQPTDTLAHYSQPILPWTYQHLASYLALAEVACPWNVEPG